MSREDNALDAAVQDSVTGLYNLVYFQHEADHTLRRAIRSQSAFSLLLISLARLEQLRGASGADAANRVLAAVAGALGKTLRTTDVIARGENDELLVLLPETAGMVAEHVAAKLAEPLTEAGGGQEPPVSFAVGIATYPENAADLNSLFKRAREALTAALASELPSVVRSVFVAPAPSPAWAARQLALGPHRASAWERVVLSSAETPLRQDEWKCIMGAWRTNGEEWISEGAENSVLVSNIPVIGSFHFICEGWNEGLREISILGHAYEGKSAAHWGYSLHVGGDGNTCTKLGRLGATVMTLPDCTIEPQRRYRLEMIYDDDEGHVTCLLDGQRLFDYVERLHFPGFQIGVYAWGPGAHVRPLEVRLLKNRRLSAMQLADEFFQDGLIDVARQCYTAIHANCGGVSEAALARLKGARCLAVMNDINEARRELQSIRGNDLEPYALSEEALLCFKAEDYRHSLELFEDSFKRFPASPARHLVVPAVTEARSRERSFDALRRVDLDVRARFNRLGQETCAPPSYSQIRSAMEWARVNWQSGAWRAALDNMLMFRQRMMPSQYDVADFQLTLLVTALANGREDLLPDDPSISQIWNCEWAPDWCSGFLLHAAVRKEAAAKLIDEYLAAEKEFPQINDIFEIKHGILLLYLALNRRAEAAQFLRSKLAPEECSHGYFRGYFVWYWVGGSLIEAGVEALFKEFLEPLEPLASSAGSQSAEARTLSLLKTRWAIEHGDFDAAADAISGWDPPALIYQFSEGLVLQALLSSLKVLKSPSPEELSASLDKRLAGVELHLADIFLRHAEPRPDDRWPHPRWRPEFRLWLARWLNAKGEASAAHAIAEPAVDSRYGLTHSQPALSALLTEKG